VSNSAAIDLGTNTARLLIGSCGPESIEQNCILRRITRLGGGFSPETGISPEARDRTLGDILYRSCSDIPGTVPG